MSYSNQDQLSQVLCLRWQEGVFLMVVRITPPRECFVVECKPGEEKQVFEAVKKWMDDDKIDWNWQDSEEAWAAIDEILQRQSSSTPSLASHGLTLGTIRFSIWEIWRRISGASS